MLFEICNDLRSHLGGCRSFANANVLLVLGELMGSDEEDGSPSRKAIPLIAGAIVLAQLTMACATPVGGRVSLSLPLGSD